METQQQQQQNHDPGNKNNNNNSSSSYLCRQSTSRWTPTSDQIRILKELYYNNGIRSPTADQIQRIAARLRHYGKIEGKNVFYWFQNHKARERQKKRFIPPSPLSTSPFSDQHQMHCIQSHHPRLPHYYNQQPKLYTTNHIIPPGGGSFSSQSSIPVSCGYGLDTTDKCFMEHSISPVESRVTNIHNFGSWVKIMHKDETPGEEDQRTTSTQIETLPLFPIHGGHNHDGIFNMDSSLSEYNDGVYFTGGNWFHSDSRTSLELSLGSYGYYN